jgi:mRNA interferase HigB
VNVISRRTLKEFASAHADAADELDRWFAVARRSRWRSLLEVRQTFADADQYRSLLIFNIRHNAYRLIVKVDFQANLIMVKEFLKHKEYDRGEWKKWAL